MDKAEDSDPDDGMDLSKFIPKEHVGLAPSLDFHSAFRELVSLLFSI